MTSQTSETAVIGFPVSIKAHLAQYFPNNSPTVSMITKRLGNLVLGSTHFHHIGHGYLPLTAKDLRVQWRAVNAQSR